MASPLDSIPFLPEISQRLDVPPEVAAAALAALVLLAFLLTAIAVRLALGPKKSNLVVLLGLPGSGKTSLFLQLRDGSVHGGTVTSMETNEGAFPLHSELAKNPKARPVRLVDVPGHPRLRGLVDPLLQRASAVVYLVDALDFMPQIRANAEFLYEVLTNPAVQRRRVPILIAANKMEKVTASSVDFIRKQLEKELDKLRVSRHTTLGVSEGKATMLGVKGEPFKFTQCPNVASPVECSVTTGKVGDIESFIRQHVRA